MKRLFFLLLPFLILSCKDSGTSGTDEIEGLIWSEEFNGTDWRDNWYPNLGFGNNGWGNNELQEYTAFDDNIVVTDSTLQIIARKVGNGQDRGDYTSGRLLTKETWQYGRMEIRAKIPDLKGPGLWPAIWMLGEKEGVGWPERGEIDIMEYVSRNPNVFFSTVHTGAFNHTNGTQKGSGDVSLPDIEEEFNIFGIIWTEDYIKFYVEDKDNIIFRFNKLQDATEDEWPFENPHFFILNLAVGGNFGGAVVDDANFPATFEIDYVRIFELDED